MSSHPEKEEVLTDVDIKPHSETSQEKSLKRYEAPRVQRYGKLHAVTHTVGYQVVDSGSNFGNIVPPT